MPRIDLDVGDKGLEVTCAIFCPAHKISGSIVRFIVDTGSEKTFLSWEDAKRLGIPVNVLPHHPKSIAGFGGVTEARAAREVFHLMFETEDGRAHMESLPQGFLIWRPSKRRKKGRMIRIPGVNILGRDFLENSQFILYVDIANRVCYLKK